MARPQKNTVDYFPFYCDDGKKMFYIEHKYKNDGFATFIKLLRGLGKTEYHYLDLSIETTIMFYSAQCHVDEDRLKDIIDDIVKLGKFDRDMWTQHQIVWCQDFIDSIQDAYKKRTNKCIDYNGLILHLERLGVRKPTKRPPEASDNPQTILNYIILEKRKENYTDEKRFSFHVQNTLATCMKFFPKDIQKTANPNNWMDTIDKLHRLDGYDHELIINVISWARNDKFWKEHFLSVMKLRKKNKDEIPFFAVFHAKMNSGEKINGYEQFSYDDMVKMHNKNPNAFEMHSAVQFPKKDNPVWIHNNDIDTYELTEFKVKKNES